MKQKGDKFKGMEVIKANEKFFAVFSQFSLGCQYKIYYQENKKLLKSCTISEVTKIFSV